MNTIMENKGKVEGDKRKETSSVFEESDVEVSPVNPVSSRPQKKSTFNCDLVISYLNH